MPRRPEVGSAIACFPIACLAACASTGAGYRATDVVEVRLPLDPSNACRASLDGRDFALPADEESFFAALRSRAKASPAARVTGDEPLPYTCFGRAVLFVQHAGFRHVGFVAEPPSPPRPEP